MAGLRQNGFTLIELLVVVLILGILSALSITKMRQVVETGRFKEVMDCITALKREQANHYLKRQRYADTEADLAAGCTFKYYERPVLAEAGCSWSASFQRQRFNPFTVTATSGCDTRMTFVCGGAGANYCDRIIRPLLPAN